MVKYRALEKGQIRIPSGQDRDGRDVFRRPWIPAGAEFDLPAGMEPPHWAEKVSKNTAPSKAPPKAPKASRSSDIDIAAPDDVSGIAGYEGMAS